MTDHIPDTRKKVGPIDRAIEWIKLRCDKLEEPKTDGVDIVINLAKVVENLAIADYLEQYRAEFDALTRLARLVQNEDGSDGVLVEFGKRAVAIIKLHQEDEYDSQTLIGLSKALAEARRAMEDANENNSD